MGQLDNSTAVFRPAEGPVKAFDLAPDGKSFAYAVDGSSVLRLRRTAEPAQLRPIRRARVGDHLRRVQPQRRSNRSGLGQWYGPCLTPIEGGVPGRAAFEGQRSAITGVVFDHTASRLLLRNGSIRDPAFGIWPMTAGFAQLGRALDVRFSPDGKSVASSTIQPRGAVPELG